jgi:hypothetical protein
MFLNPDLANTFTRQLQHMQSVNFKFEDDLGVRTISAGKGIFQAERSLGFMIMLS